MMRSETANDNGTVPEAQLMGEEVEMDRNDWICIDDAKPSLDGWYAVTRCWDPEEGMFPGAAQWIDGAWEDSAATKTVVLWQGPFASDPEATDWAYAHDIEDPGN